MSFNKKTTVVQNTGLGDDQYKQIQTNQGTLDTNMTTGFDVAGTKLDSISGDVSGLGSKIDTGVEGINTGVNAGFTNISSLLDTYNSGMNTQFDAVNAGVGNNANALATNNQALGNLQTDVTGGFDEAGNRFDTIDTATGNIQGTVDQGFVDQAQGFSDAQSDRTTRFDQSDLAMGTGFADAGTAMQKGFGDASSELTATQAEVLGGQGSLQGSLDTMAEDNTTYANQALENQAALTQGQEGFQSSFDTYADRYTDDTRLAVQTRNDMQTANANANIRLREDIGGFADAATSQVDSVAKGLDSQITTLGNTVEGGFVAAQNQSSAQAQATAQADAEFVKGLSNLDAGQITQARDLAKVAASQTDLDMGMRQEFTQLGNAFDDSGELIESSIDKQGNTISRAMDDQGNLILNSFDVSGQGLGTKTINLRTTLESLNGLQNKQGASSSMGNLSAASSSAVPQSGFAQPFAQTG